MRARYLIAGILVGIVISAAGLGKAHRLSGHPRSLQGKLALAKAQVRHDQREASMRTHEWTWLSPLPLQVLWHRNWLHRDVAYLKLLTRLSSPRVSVDGCLSALISRESGWNVHATNPVTGAYGLPQALPGSKMASAGADWRDNAATQIRWMLGYVNARYGGSCSALAFQEAHGYY